MTEIRIRYNRVVDALYIRLRDGEAAESEEMEPGIIVDYNEDYNEEGEIVGIEVLGFPQAPPRPHKAGPGGPRDHSSSGHGVRICYTLHALERMRQHGIPRGGAATWAP